MNVLVPLVVYGTTVLVALAIGFAVPLGHRPLLVAGILFGLGVAIVPVGIVALSTVGGLVGVAIALAGLVLALRSARTERRAVVEDQSRDTAEHDSG